MKYCLKLFIPALIILSLFLFSVNTAYAADFDAKYKVVYDVSVEGNTHVSQDVIFVNRTKNRYATKYSISIGSGNIKNIKAKDTAGEIKPEIVTKEDTTDINLSFNEKVIGIDKALNFNINYDISDVASHNGLLWEVNIPKLATEESISEYSLELRVPGNFGPLHYISPLPQSTLEKDIKSYFFSKDQVLKSGIVAVFGEAQIFDLTLKYHLLNQNVFAGYTDVVFPPDTVYQQVNYLSITPMPSEIFTDPDGNYLGRYQLEAGKKLDITVKLQIKTISNDQKFYTLDWAKADLSVYTRPDRYWETNHPLIIEKAKELKTPEKIFEFTSSYLKYGYDRLKESKIERFGAVSALNNPEVSICMEYTDLTIALLRASGIPARELNGYAYTKNKKLRPVSIGGEESSDVLHAWVEYFDKEKGYWVQVDPTWTSTTGGIDYFNKLDNNHLVFVIKGLSSEQPHPAGSYKYADQKGKDVDVDFAKESKFGDIATDVSISNKTVVSGFPSNSSLTITNKSGRALQNNTINITTNKTDVLSKNSLKFDILPPFGKINLDLKFKEKDLIVTRDENVNVKLVGYNGLDKIDINTKDKLKIQPFYVYARVPLLLVFIPLVLLTLITIILKTQVKMFKIPSKLPKK